VLVSGTLFTLVGLRLGFRGEGDNGYDISQYLVLNAGYTITGGAVGLMCATITGTEWWKQVLVFALFFALHVVTLKKNQH
ncbi:MAG: hypothetical protein ABIP54_00405, partial [Candidatus Andersenbacteria bacterium]